MSAQRIAFSRDIYSAGTLTIGAAAVPVPFAPQMAYALPAAPAGAPSDAVPMLFADRILVSNLGAHPMFVRPIIPGSTDAPSFPVPRYPGAQGTGELNAAWTCFSPSGFTTSGIATDATHAIAVPAGAIAFPIDLVAIGLVIAGTSGDQFAWAAYGSASR